MTEQQCPFVDVELLEGSRQRAGLLAGEGRLLRAVVAVMLDESVQVPSVDRLAATVFGNDVASRHDGVGTERLIVEAIAPTQRERASPG
ncbi:MAG: hypothetical protein WKF58_19690 [Ilumatobacteraceae bacterium]